MVKEKADHQRLYDMDGFKKRAACVCVKNENENEVLLISSSRNDNHWIVPGGGIEVNENPEDAAEREVYEEAGVQGRLGRFLGVFESINRKHRTSVYILVVDKELEDWEERKAFGRKRKWFDLSDAKQELEKHKPVQGSYLNLLKGYENNRKNAFFDSQNHNNNNSNDVNILLQSNTDNNNEFTNNVHCNGSLSHQNFLISALSNVNKPFHLSATSPANLLISSPFSYNNAPSHLDCDILSSNNAATLLNSNTT